MNRITRFLLIVFVGFGLGGCSSKEDNTERTVRALNMVYVSDYGMPNFDIDIDKDEDLITLTENPYETDYLFNNEDILFDRYYATTFFYNGLFPIFGNNSNVRFIDFKGNEYAAFGKNGEFEIDDELNIFDGLLSSDFLSENNMEQYRDYTSYREKIIQNPVQSLRVLKENTLKEKPDYNFEIDNNKETYSMDVMVHTKTSEFDYIVMYFIWATYYHGDENITVNIYSDGAKLATVKDGEVVDYNEKLIDNERINEAKIHFSL